MRENVPSEPFAFFVDRLLSTIRDEIASCMEKAYEQVRMGAREMREAAVDTKLNSFQMSSKDAAKMLQLDSRAASKYIAERGWTTEKGRVKFAAPGTEGEDGGEAHARAFNEEVGGIAVEQPLVSKDYYLLVLSANLSFFSGAHGRAGQDVHHLRQGDGTNRLIFFSLFS